jgi:serine/threonine-protein kinase RsbW
LARSKRRGPPDRPGADGWSFARGDLRYRLRVWIPSTHPAINRAVDQVCNLADRCGCPEDGQADLEIAVREALANAISHGNRRRPGRKVFLRCYGGPRAGILVAVRDQGDGFDPETVPDPRSEERMHLNHGRGLLLMRELTDRVEFRRGGSEVVLFHKLKR